MHTLQQRNHCYENFVYLSGLQDLSSAGFPVSFVDIWFSLCLFQTEFNHYKNVL